MSRMIRVTYRLIMEASDPRQPSLTKILIRFSTGMEITAGGRRLADSLTLAANGGAREMRTADGAKLTVGKHGHEVHLKTLSPPGIRAIDLSPPMAQLLALDLTTAYRTAMLPFSSTVLI